VAHQLKLLFFSEPGNRHEEFFVQNKLIPA
jgi:hypothetical protein